MLSGRDPHSCRGWGFRTFSHPRMSHEEQHEFAGHWDGRVDMNPKVGGPSGPRRTSPSSHDEIERSRGGSWVTMLRWRGEGRRWKGCCGMIDPGTKRPMARFIRLSQGLKAHRGLRTTAVSSELWFLGSCLMRKIATGIRIGLSTTASWPLSNAAATMMVPPTVTSMPAQKMRLEAR